MKNSPELSLLCLIRMRLTPKLGPSMVNFELGPQEFAANVLRIIDRRLGAVSTSFESLSFFKTLHLSDLYLAMACGNGHESAWSRYADLYRTYIHDVARLVCRKTRTQRETSPIALAATFSCPTVLGGLA